MPTRDLTTEIGAAGQDLAELVIVLQGHFRSANIAVDKATFGSDGRLIINVTKRGGFSISSGPAFDRSEIPAIRSAIDASLGHSVPAIFTTVAFTDRPVRGSFAAPDGTWRVRPVPPEAPTSTKAGQRHPLVVEVMVDTSSEKLVTSLRVARARQRWLSIVSALLLGRFTIIEPSRSMWSAYPEGETEHAFLATERYAFEGNWGQRDSWGELPSPHVGTVPDQDYYRHWWVPTEDFSVPAGFADDLRRVSALSGTAAERFMTAGRWRAAASRVHDTHSGLWYVAMSAAIEALAASEADPDPCPECGRDRSQHPTREFRDFLERYAAGPGNQKRLETLYRVRSSLVHGRGSLDVGTWTDLLGSSPLTLRDTSHMYNIELVVSRAMVNWLRGAAHIS